MLEPMLGFSLVGAFPARRASSEAIANSWLLLGKRGAGARVLATWVPFTRGVPRASLARLVFTFLGA